MADFDMDAFNEAGVTDTPEESGYSECGGVGCIVGHATLCIEPLRRTENWHQYSERMFGVDSETAEWDWLFGPRWKKRDNTPEGAAARIDWYMNNGLPQNWWEQMYDVDPLCYRQGT